MAKLILFTGKGGVGKSTTSAANAYYYSSQGYKTLLVSSDPAHSTEDVVGIPIGFQPTMIKENLWAKNINAQEKAKQFMEKMNDGLENSVSKWFPGFDSELLTDWASFPGMDEVFALEEIMHLVQSVEYDLIVFDTAPTGHTLKALTTPESINSFLLRILRMKARIENVKGFFLKKGDTSKLVKLLEEMIDMIKRIKSLLRNQDFVSINLVSIPTEAGFQEFVKTVKFLTNQGFKVNNLIVNNIIPTFDEETWSMANNNKAVGLLKAERDIQQIYLKKYHQFTTEGKINMLGVSKLPFEPIGSKLQELEVFLRKFNFKPIKSITVESTDNQVKYKLYLPNDGNLKLNKNSYTIDYYTYELPFAPQHEGQKVRKQKTQNGANYTYKV